jgi:hypothetical protein
MRTSEAASELAGKAVQRVPGRAISQNRLRTRGNRRFREEDKIKAPQNSVNAKCSTCEGKFRSRRRVKTEKSFCSPHCRLLFWTAKKLLEAYRAGQADGLWGLIKELAEVKR